MCRLGRLVARAVVAQDSVWVIPAGLETVRMAPRRCDGRARSAAAALAALPTESASVDRRMGRYVSDLVRKTLADFE